MRNGHPEANELSTLLASGHELFAQLDEFATVVPVTDNAEHMAGAQVKTGHQGYRPVTFCF